MKFGMRALLILMLLMFFSSPVRGHEAHDAVEDITRIRKGVVRLSVTSQVPDYRVPWNPGRITRGVGTGFLIPGKRILTNAHISSNARFIAIQKEADSRMYEAKVEFIAHDCDLALLEVPEKSFFDGMSPLSLGGMPSLDSSVTVLGYPIGGRRLSVTRGVVSRIDFTTYSHSAADSHLTIQIDAAINPGNSGGPVLQNNAVVGVAFQGFSGDVAQNVGYMIPVPVIERFLTDIKDGRYDRYVDLSIHQFPLLNNAYRRAVGLAPGDYGVIVSSVLKTSPGAGILKPGDVLLTIDGLPIFSNGYVKIDDERVRMEEVVERKYKGDSVRLKILRDRREIDLTVPLGSPWPYLIQARRHDVKPRFVVFGGLVFQPLSYDFLKSSNIKDINIIYHSDNFINNELYLKTPEIVVLSKILPDPVNVYLHGFVNSIVQKINDKDIRTLEDVSEAFKERADYYVIRLLGKHRPVVLERKEVEEARNRIIKGYGVLKEEYLGDSIVPAEWLDASLKKN
jgi:S1-C subfamily serine protease